MQHNINMIVWLASYPRSGNTFLRVVFKSIFNIKTYSIYDDQNDIGIDKKTTEVVGHQFLPKNFNIKDARKAKEIYFIKTHELFEKTEVKKGDKIIYLVRDGRESCFSFSKYLQNFNDAKEDSLMEVLQGDAPFGSWGNHVRSWNSVEKKIIKFEDLVDNPYEVSISLSHYLNIKFVNNNIPTFKELHKINPKFFRKGKKDSWKNEYSHEEISIFWKNNISEMIYFGYTDFMPIKIRIQKFFKSFLKK